MSTLSPETITLDINPLWKRQPLRMVRHMFDLASRQAKRSANALKFGKVFLLNRWFKMPGTVLLGGKTRTLHYPPEHGVHNDFLACFISNEYGLGDRLGPIKTILDVGSNIGFFSLAARGHYAHATIHAYEPNPLVLEYLDKNTAGLNIQTFHEALGSGDGYVSIIEGGDSNQAKTRTSENGAIKQVSFQTAIDRLGGTVDLLKLDCEGAEWDLFQAQASWQNIKNIRMEYHLFNGESVGDVQQALHRLGFEITYLQPSSGFGTLWAVQRGNHA